MWRLVFFMFTLLHVKGKLYLSVQLFVTRLSVFLIQFIRYSILLYNQLNKKLMLKPQCVSRHISMTVMSALYSDFAFWSINL